MNLVLSNPIRVRVPPRLIPGFKERGPHRNFAPPVMNPTLKPAVPQNPSAKKFPVPRVWGANYPKKFLEVLKFPKRRFKPQSDIPVLEVP